MPTVLTFFTERGNLRREYKPTTKLKPGTLIFVPKTHQGGLAVMAEIPKDPGRGRSKCCHGNIVGALDLGEEINRFDEIKVDTEIQRLALNQGCTVTKMEPACLTCHATLMYCVHKRPGRILGRRSVIPTHVVAQQSLNFRAGLCCEGEGNDKPSRWGRIFSLLPKRLWPLSART